jgi:hypothetical protein
VTNYVAGRNAEYRSMRLLEASGYKTARTAGSHGTWDVIGLGPVDILLVQVKRGGKPAINQILAEMRDEQANLAPNVRQALHWWRERAREPEVYTP